MLRLLPIALLTACALPAETEPVSETSQAIEECATVYDCGFIPTKPCSQPACVGGFCVQQNTPNGELANAIQVHGDCRKTVCNNLQPIVVAEAKDIPFPPWECARSYCRGLTPVVVPLPCLDPSAPE